MAQMTFGTINWRTTVGLDEVFTSNQRKVMSASTAYLGKLLYVE